MAGRAVPLPEEGTEQRDSVGRRAVAEEILRESEERVADAAEANAPGDVADEHRSSEQTVGP